MTKLKLLATFLLLSAVSALAQNYVSISASNIHDSGSNLLASGTVYFAPVDASGKPISYQAGGGGQTISWPVVFTITNGAFNGLIANSAVTNPVNVCYAVTVLNALNQIVLGGKPNSGYQCVQTATTNFWCASGACNFDQYFPQANGIPLTATPPPSTLSLGGIYSGICPSSQLATGYDTNGRIVCGTGAGTGNVTGPNGSVGIGDVAAYSNTLGTLLLDTGLVYTNLVTQLNPGAVNQVCTYTGANKICVPGQVPTAALVNPGLTINTAAPLSGGGIVNLGGSITLGISNIANSSLLNSTVGINGAANQITSSNSNPALGGSTTLNIANPFIFPGKFTAASGSSSAASAGFPSGVAPTSPVAGDFWNQSGTLKFFDGALTNALVSLNASVTTGHCVQFADTIGHVSDSGNPCGTGTGGGSQITVNGGGALASPTNLQNGTAVNGLSINVSNPTGANVQWALSGTLNNTGLTNPSLTFNGQTVALGATGNIPFQTAGVNNVSLQGVNFVASSADVVGLHIAVSNPGTNQERHEITGGSYTGNAATATAFAALPAQCTGSQFAVGVTANGNANCSTPAGGGGSASPNQSISFTAATSASLTVASATSNITWNCWDNSSPANAVYPSNVTVDPGTFLTTFNFTSPQSGYCVVNSTGSGVYASAESGTSWSVPAATHNMGSAVLVETFDASGNRIYGNVNVDGSGNVVVSWLMSQVGKVVIAP